MSTTVELVRANERYARLRAAVEALAAEWEGWADGRSTPRIDAFRHAAEDLRALLAAVDS